MKTCENCVYCTRENYCTHREGPYKTWSENHCNNFESKEKDNEVMNEELRKKYGNMTIDDMIKKMERQEVWINALEQDGRNYHNELLENRARISDLERAYDRLYEENEALDKRATELVKSAEEKDEQIENLKNELDEANAEIGELGGRINERHATNRELAKNCVRLETENREKEAKIASLTQELADKKNQIWRLNEDIAKYCEDINPKIGTITARLTFKENQVMDLEKKLAEKNEVIDKMEDQIEELENEVKRKRAIIKDLTEQIAEKNKRIEDKDDVIADLDERLEHQKHIILNYERDIVRYSKSDEEKKYLENDISLSKAFYEIGKHVSPGFIDAIKAYGKKCEEEMKPKLSYKCCPEIKKLIDDAGYMRDYMERILRGDKSYNLDIASLYPTKFELNPNADCPTYAARMKAKYNSLIKVGFTEDQAMSLIPMWTDD